MDAGESQMNVRPMTGWDLKAIFSIDQRIRATKVSLTYKEFATQDLFGMNFEKMNSQKRSTVFGVGRLLDFSFVAETEGLIRGFVVGRQTYLAERGIEEGEIAIIGVDPDYRGRGIATTLVNTICDSFRSRSIRTVRIRMDPRDKDLPTFFEDEGFSKDERPVLYYTKTLQVVQ